LYDSNGSDTEVRISKGRRAAIEIDDEDEDEEMADFIVPDEEELSEHDEWDSQLNKLDRVCHFSDPRICISAACLLCVSRFAHNF
jgi:hypothetical protein